MEFKGFVSILGVRLMFPGREAEHRLASFQTIGHGVEEEN